MIYRNVVVLIIKFPGVVRARKLFLSFMTFVPLTMGRPCCFLEVQEENVEEIAAFCVPS